MEANSVIIIICVNKHIDLCIRTQEFIPGSPQHDFLVDTLSSQVCLFFSDSSSFKTMKRPSFSRSSHPLTSLGESHARCFSHLAHNLGRVGELLEGLDGMVVGVLGICWWPM